MSRISRIISPASDSRRWWALALLAIADFVVVLDATIVNIALPSIGADLHASTDQLSWVISAYLLTFGGLLLFGGRLADLFGRRRLFIGGLTLFGLASLAGGASGSIGELIALRAVQGVGAAALAPAARSIVTTIFQDGPERAKALGIWGAVAGSGSVVGLLLGGILTSGLSWRWVLLVNVPVSLGAAALAPRLLDESRAETDRRTIDIAGATLATGGLVSGLYALVQANSAGWTSLQTVGLLCVSAALLTAFAAVERRVVAPLLSMRVLRIPAVRGANVTMTVTAAAMVGLFFVLVLYQQEVLHYSALTAGLTQLPLGVSLIAMAGAAGPLTDHFGPRTVVITGGALFTIGVAWMAQIPIRGSFLADILGPSLIIGTGLGLTFVALTVASSTGVDETDAGVAGGLITSTQQIGGALGLAVITAVAGSPAAHATGISLATRDHAFQHGLLVAAGSAVLSTALPAIALPRRNRTHNQTAATPLAA